MNKEEWLSICADSVHRLDRDRLMCSTLAPDDKQESLIALLAFNLEIAAIPDIVSESLLGEMRLQWWRDAIGSFYEGGRLDHPVALGVADAIQAHNLSRHLFNDYLDAGSFDLSDEPPKSLTELESHAEASAGSLNELMAEALGSADLEGDLPKTVHLAARQSAIAWALTGWLYDGRSRYLPIECEKPVLEIAEAAWRLIHQSRSVAGKIPKAFLPVMMPTYLASHRLKRLAQYDYDATHEKLRRPALGRLPGFYWKVLTKSY